MEVAYTHTFYSSCPVLPTDFNKFPHDLNKCNNFHGSDKTIPLYITTNTSYAYLTLWKTPGRATTGLQGLTLTMIQECCNCL